MARREFTRTVKSEIVRRATINNRICCEGCGIDLTGKKIEIDHIIADALVLDKSAKLTAADGQLLGECCHRGEGGKTAKDVKAVAKAKRNEGKRSGTIKPKGKIKSAGFPKEAKEPRERNKALPPRVIYRSVE